MFGDGFNNTYNKSTKLYEMKYMNYYNFTVENSGTLVRVMQDYPAISSLFECNKIILTSNLNSRSETMTMSYTNSNISVMQETLNILFDAYYSPAVARSEFIYVASTTDRSVNLLGSNTLDSIKLNVYYETKTGQKYPVKLKYGDIVNVKIKFTKKR